MTLKLIPYLLVAIMAIGGFFYIKNLGKVACESEQKTEVIKAVDKRQKINHAVKNLNHDKLVDELDDGGWLRGNE